MKRLPLFLLLLSPTLLLASCDDKSSSAEGGETVEASSVEENSSQSAEPTPVSSSASPSSEPSAEPTPSSVSEELPPFDLQQAKDGLKKSRPTKIVTNHTYTLSSSGVELGFHSTLLIDYEGEVRSAYSYVYQVLAEIVDESSPLYRTISGKKYSSGAQIGDGVEWVNAFEGATTLTSLNLSSAIAEVDEDLFTASGLPSDPTAFLGKDYHVSDLHYLLEYEPSGDAYYVKALTLDFKMAGYAGLFGEETATIHSESFYSYDSVSVTFPD